MNKIEGMGEQDKIHYFIKGLAPKTRAETGYQNPQTLQGAIDIATNFEKHFFGVKTSGVVHSDIVPMDVNYAKTAKTKVQTTYNNRIQNFHVSQKKNHFRKDNKNDLAKVKCFNCGTFGHYAKFCKKESKDKVQRYGKSKYDREVVNTLYNGNKNLLNTFGHISNCKMNVVFDTGATKSIMSKLAAEKFCFKIIPTKQVINIADGSQTQAIGSTEVLSIQIHGTICELSFIILPLQEIDVLLGLDWFKLTKAIIDPTNFILKFPSKEVNLHDSSDDVVDDAVHDCLIADNLLADEEDVEGDEVWSNQEKQLIMKNELLSNEEQKIFSEFIEINADVFAYNFKDLGTCTVSKHHIQTSTEKPIYIPPYRRSLKEAKEIETEVKSMLEANIIRPSKSPWSFPVLLVPKKDGSRRFCVDYRQLNKITVPDQFPIPRIDDILDRTRNGVWFSSLDLKSGYWQVALDEESIPKTAFTTTTGHFEFIRMPFGLMNAPRDFSRIISIICGDLDFVIAYFDDFCILSKTYDEHLNHLLSVFQRFKKYDIKINPSKCKWFQKKIVILGHVFSEKGIQMDPAKIDAIKGMIPPKNVKQLQQFLGLCGYYRKFVEGFAKIAAPLYNLLKKDIVWEWTDECQKAFEILKAKLISYPTLRQPDLSQQFLLFTDASGRAVGAILSQKDEIGKEYVCCYASRMLKDSERSFCITDKECLAVVWAIKYFRIYLYGVKFKVITDHKALITLKTNKDIDGRLARWSLYLQIYDFEIIHRKGLSHTNVDVLSRPVLLASENECFEEIEEQEFVQPDPYEDETLIYFLKFARYPNGCSKKQIKRIKKIIQHYKLVNDELRYRKLINIDSDFDLIIPRKEDRIALIKKAHILGHFQENSTYDRLKDKYFWKEMLKDIKNVVSSCLVCQ